MANGVPGQPPQVVVPGAGWVDVASRAITTVGFPVVIAGVLLWFLLGTFQKNMEAITARMQANTEAAAKLVATAQGEIEELQHQTTHMAKQTEMMSKVVDQVQQIAALHQAELAELKTLSGKGTPP